MYLPWISRQTFLSDDSLSCKSFARSMAMYTLVSEIQMDSHVEIIPKTGTLSVFLISYRKIIA
jgi:hypothetical protein